MQFVIATNNQNKVQEIEEILDLPNCDYFSLADLGLISDPEENGKDFYGNAKIKACSALEEIQKSKNALSKLSGDKTIILTDDSGLCVDALGGAPGIKSARYASEDNNNASGSSNNEKLLTEMKDFSDRKAHFECCVVALILQKNNNFKELSFVGQCHGTIGCKEYGTQGFGYDPLFLPDTYARKKTMAQLSPEEKNEISHRAIALKKLQNSLQMC